MDKNDLGLLLGALSALAIFIGPIAALVIVAFVAGVMVGGRREKVRAASRHRRLQSKSKA